MIRFDVCLTKSQLSYLRNIAKGKTTVAEQIRSAIDKYIDIQENLEYNRLKKTLTYSPSKGGVANGTNI